jgi:hypothetical protein
MSKQIGDVGELSFMLKAKTIGLTVLTPFSSINSYDVAIDNGRNILKIQVKTVNALTIRHGKRTPGVYSAILARGSDQKTQYNSNDVDYFAIFIMPLNEFFIIPFNAITTKTIKLHPFKKDHKFSKYQENWNLLK